MLRLDLLQSLEQRLLQGCGVLRHLLAQDLADGCHGRRAANGIARVRACHRTGSELVHDDLFSEHCRERQRTADALAAANEVRLHALVMLECPELPRASESSLNFVERK